ncbi:E2-like conjugating enzyme atg10 [Bulinus truncatus]|nr:E2-like conjugating enzyme atg10 [Bulinus truncatus]
MAAGSISLGEFRSLVENFVDISNKIDDKWHLVIGIDNLYMCKKNTVILKTSNKIKDTDVFAKTMIADMEMGDSVEDVSCMSGDVVNQTLTYEYHVIYSESYAVPVLYFNIYKSDGGLLPLDEIWKLCPSYFHAYLQENKWATLTQQDHPILGHPFVQLHPCHTAELMAQVMRKTVTGIKQNYLVTWLSTVCPLVGLHIPSAYIMQMESS